MATNIVKPTKNIDLTENLTENLEVLIYDGWAFCLTPTTTLERDLDIRIKQRGLIVYNSDTDIFEYYDGTAWIPFATGTPVPPTVVNAINGLHLDGTDAKLGGALIENTTITGNFDLNLGDKSNLIKSLVSYTNTETLLNSNDGVTQSELHLSPSDFALTANDGTTDSGFVFQTSSPTGITVKDGISNIGLRGDVVFTPTDAKDFVQKGYVDSVLTNPLIPMGNWNSLTNTPTLVSSTSPGGNYWYIVSVASSGVTTLDGLTDFLVGEAVYFANGTWNIVQENHVDSLQYVTDQGNITTNDMFVTVGADSTAIRPGYIDFNEDTTYVGQVGASALTFVDTDNPLNIKDSIVTASSLSIRDAFLSTTLQTDGLSFAEMVGSLRVNVIPPATITANSTVIIPQNAVDRVLTVSVGGKYADANGNVNILSPSAIRLFDDFMKKPSTTTNGDLGWTLTGTGATAYNTGTAELGHPGIGNFSSTATAGQNSILHLSDTASAGNMAYGDVENFTYYVKFPTFTGASYFLGLSQNFAGAAANNIVLRKLSTDTNFQLVNTSASVSTVTNTGILPVINTWYKFRVETTLTDIKYYINDVLIATVATNIPAASILLLPGLFIQPTIAGVKSILIDAFEANLKPIR